LNPGFQVTEVLAESVAKILIGSEGLRHRLHSLCSARSLSLYPYHSGGPFAGPTRSNSESVCTSAQLEKLQQEIEEEVASLSLTGNFAMQQQAVTVFGETAQSLAFTSSEANLSASLSEEVAIANEEE
jgi:hypothetical protein